MSVSLDGKTWVRRTTKGKPTRWHRIDSERAGRFVTRCGRELGPQPGSDLEVVRKPLSVDRCQDCKAEGGSVA